MVPVGGAGAATIRLVGNDVSGEGLLDDTPASPQGGNPGRTIGELRRNALLRAAQMWADVLVSPVEIVVEVGFNPLSCDSESAVLGQASASTLHIEFAGAPERNVYYVAALANRLAGVDLCPPGRCTNSADIRATFSSSFGTTCEFGGFWYYGFDESPPPGAADFITVALHEIGHGLGFISFARLSTGGLFRSRFDAFTAQMEYHGVGPFAEITNSSRADAFVSGDRLHLIGARTLAAGAVLSQGLGEDGHVQLYAPGVIEGGSSVSHFDTALFPNQLMEPVLRFAAHDVGLAAAVLSDLGWTTQSPGCIGDCDGDSTVGASELVLAVRVALQDAPVSDCSGADADQDGKVGISELVGSVRSALNGCGGEVVDELPVRRGVLEAAACRGDCDGDGRVAIQELVRGVNIALGRLDASECEAMDGDGDGRVTISELIAAVTSLLEGCYCPFDFTGSGVGTEACVFAGTWNDTCGDDGLPATFGVVNGTLGVAIVTGDGSPELTFVAQVTGARQANLIGYMFGEEVAQLGGTVSLAADGSGLIVSPDGAPDVVIDDCLVTHYDGSFVRVVSVGGSAAAQSDSERLQAAVAAMRHGVRRVAPGAHP